MVYEHRFEREEHGPCIELTVADVVARYVEWLKLHRATGSEVEQSRMAPDQGVIWKWRRAHSIRTSYEETEP